MNVKPYKRRENSDFFKPINSNILNNIDINSQGKIQEKLITINAHNIPYPKENKIKELEITLKPNKIYDKIISPKNDHQPYLKPKFKLKNRNSFFIKNKNKGKTEFMTNDGIKDLNLNLLRIYYDENGKNIKIIREKDINKEKEKEKNNNKNDIKKKIQIIKYLIKKIKSIILMIHQIIKIINQKKVIIKKINIYIQILHHKVQQQKIRVIQKA